MRRAIYVIKYASCDMRRAISVVRYELCDMQFGGKVWAGMWAKRKPAFNLNLKLKLAASGPLRFFYAPYMRMAMYSDHS